MPVYEYVCLDCRDTFDALRPMDQADAPIVCEGCESEHTSRTLSIFFARSNGQSLNSNTTAGSPAGLGGAGCACGGSCSCASLN